MEMPPSLSQLALKIFGTVDSAVFLQQHASSRQRWRITHSRGTQSAIGVSNPQDQENRAFLGFTTLCKELQLPVPSIYGENLAEGVYLEEDLGSHTLYEVVEHARSSDHTEDVFERPEIRSLLRSSLQQLAAFQVRIGPRLDRSLCYQGAFFDRVAVGRDLLRFDRELIQRLLPEERRKGLAPLLQSFADQFTEMLETELFMYRDFQSRNIMVHQNKLVFIDYQSGRLGPPEYDAVSFLFQSRLGLPPTQREELYELYLQELEQASGKSCSHRRERLPFFVALRALQTLGAYGDLGLGQGKPAFISVIPAALENLREALDKLPGAPARGILAMVQHAEEFAKDDKALNQYRS